MEQKVKKSEFYQALTRLFEYVEALEFRRKHKKITDEEIVECLRVIELGRGQIYDKDFMGLGPGDSIMAVAGPINIQLNLIKKWYSTYVGIGYRIPEFKEFIQDFEFEYLATRGGEGMVTYIGEGGTLTKAEVFRVPITKTWTPMKVWWKPRSKEEAKRVSEYPDGTKITWFVGEIDAPISVRHSIEDKLVRVKI